MRNHNLSDIYRTRFTSVKVLIEYFVDRVIIDSYIDLSYQQSWLPFSLTQTPAPRQSHVSCSYRAENRWCTKTRMTRYEVLRAFPQPFSRINVSLEVVVVGCPLSWPLLPPATWWPSTFIKKILNIHEENLLWSYLVTTFTVSVSAEGAQMFSWFKSCLIL